NGGIDIDDKGFLYFTDLLTFQVAKYTRNGQLVQRFGTEGSGAGEFGRLSGLVLDADNNVFALDNVNDKVVKFDPDGNLLMEIPAVTGNPVAVDLDTEGNIYVMRSSAFTVSKYSPTGALLTEWGNTGTGPGDFGEDAPGFNGPFGLAVSKPRNEVFIADTYNERIQVFDLEGNFLRQFDGAGQGTFSLSSVDDVKFDETTGNVVVAGSAAGYVKTFTPTGTLLAEFSVNTGQIDDIAVFDDGSFVISGFNSSRIELRDTDGTLRYAFGSSGVGAGQFRRPHNVAVDAFNNFYVTDERLGNRRIQVFNAQSVLQREIDQVGGLNLEPAGIGIDVSGNIFVSDDASGELVKLDPMGNLLARCNAAVAMTRPDDLAIDPAGNVYVLDRKNFSDPSDISRVNVFSNDCVFQQTWTTATGASEEFADLFGIAAGNGSIYVADRGTDFPGATFTSRVQRISPAGVLEATALNPVFDGLTMDLPDGVAVANDGRVFVSDFFRDRVVVFDAALNPFISIGQRGHFPGNFFGPEGLAITGENRLHVVELANSRVQILSPPGLPSQDRAIIVSGGGPYPGNALWGATQANSNFAARVLSFSGYTKDRIQYLSADTDLDLDQNGLADDVDDDATVAALTDALSGDFAKNADSLLLYMVDHGGDQTFRMSGTELLTSSQLDALLDQYQAANPGVPVTVIYDACQSGSFVGPLAGNRTVIASSMADENAYFVSQGSLSFSSNFWSQVLSGETVGVAFDSASTLITGSFPNQTPQVDANGNGIANEPADFDAIAGQIIGSDILLQGDAPSIQGLTAPQVVDSGNTATLSATVLDPDGVQRVWAILRPPGFIPASPDNPVEDLPTIDLTPMGGDEFSVTAAVFSVPGTYNIAVYATDNLGNATNATLTSVTVDNPLQRKAIIVAGGTGSGAGNSAIRRNSELAYRALVQQGYGGEDQACTSVTCDSLRFLTFAGSTGRDGEPSLEALTEAIQEFSAQDAQDLTLYLIAPESSGELILSATDRLSPATLDGLLDAAQANLPGEVSVIIDASNAGAFASSLVPPSGKNRTGIYSAGVGREAIFLQGGKISFSRFFWNQVLNGASLRGSFQTARSAVRYRSAQQNPGLDDSGNGIVNEFLDGFRARRFSLGNGILLAGDDPLIGNISLPANLTSASTVLSVSEVISTGSIVEVSAFVTRPSGEQITVPMSGSGSDWSVATEAFCAGPGTYEVGVFAIDNEGATSPPITATASRASACSAAVDLAAQNADVLPAATNTGIVTFNVDAANIGSQAASATEVVIRVSEDAIVDDNDPGVVRVALASLNPGQTLPVSESLRVTSRSGTVWVAACIDTVAGESIYTNNCSAPQQVTADIEENIFANGFE
ncbi:MAG: 6-bladed beta-propeller, partial [Lysobacterales bacterium]